jgi:hypothetical protein
MIAINNLNADLMRIHSPLIIETQFIAQPFKPGLSSTENALISGNPPGTVASPVLIEGQVISPLERTIATLRRFAQMSSGGNSAPAHEALQFLNAIPKYLPVPKAVESDSGMVALFWETDRFYADVEFLGNGKFSVFTRRRTKSGPQDAVLDERPLEDANGVWLREFLGPLFQRTQPRAS